MKNNDTLKKILAGIKKVSTHAYRTTKEGLGRLWTKIKQSRGTPTFVSALIAVGIGLLIGFLILMILDISNSFYGMSNLLIAGFTELDEFIKVLYRLGPLIMTGLSVGFAYKAGLFNIGATGQFTVGAFTAVFMAIVWSVPWWVAILGAMVTGALWGAIPGVLKALFNVNEVITSIMFNWAALYFVNLWFYNTDGIAATPERTRAIGEVNPGGVLPTLGLDQVFDSYFFNIGFFIAILLAAGTWFLLEKTTFGFEVKATGANRHASEYAGMKSKRIIIMTMLIAGGLSGIGGGLNYLAGTVQYTVSTTSLIPTGFDGIPVALLAYANPLGIIASGFLIAYLKVGGQAMSPEFNAQSVDIILAVIIYFSAFALLVKQYVAKVLKQKRDIELEKETDDGSPPGTSGTDDNDEEGDR